MDIALLFFKSQTHPLSWQVQSLVYSIFIHNLAKWSLFVQNKCQGKSTPNCTKKGSSGLALILNRQSLTKVLQGMLLLKDSHTVSMSVLLCKYATKLLTALNNSRILIFRSWKTQFFCQIQCKSLNELYVKTVSQQTDHHVTSASQVPGAIRGTPRGRGR